MASTTTPVSNGRILVIDDQTANLRVVDALLRRHGYEGVLASSGSEALAAVEEQIPDLILLDMMMPGMSGFEFLDALRERCPTPPPTIFLTAAQDRDMLLRAFDAGAVDFVTKPFMPEELLARVNAHVALKRTRDRLERVARDKQELVNLVAHDLKNPLTSVLFAVELLQHPDCVEARKPRYLAIIDDATHDAIGYIRDYLEGESRRQRLQRDDAEARPSTALREVARRLFERYEPQLESKGVRLLTFGLDSDAHVAIEARVLQQVTENLLTNAIKYAPDSEEIVLGIRAGAPGFKQLVVQDRGPGIPGSARKKLFRPFQRLTEEDPANGLSSGLGLSLAHRIVADAGGELLYEDREGGGACFIIELPEVRD